MRQNIFNKKCFIGIFSDGQRTSARLNRIVSFAKDLQASPVDRSSPLTFGGGRELLQSIRAWWKTRTIGARN